MEKYLNFLFAVDSKVIEIAFSLFHLMNIIDHPANKYKGEDRIIKN